ncbi:DgyrCDS4475 [Dimorphilus gyrociliatus]|uniref:EGF domain-specific O-linked N-acetylglucosamine transferase n=1 Tax=Dimorphilus gyrociliatus TaxID=2664684 RepID=A0A7I8VH62_9ANNE|nr:DgyrCDS4475 [Dimorphilus gyrociliatus]
MRIPEEHLPYALFKGGLLGQICMKDKSCPYKKFTNSTKCWGYEEGCNDWGNRFLKPECPEKAPYGWVPEGEDQIGQWWLQGDFGYVKSVRDSIQPFCEPETETDSSLYCSENTRFCKGKNLYIDFTRIRFSENTNRFQEDIFREGEIGGHCRLNKNLFTKNGEHKSPLQSWYAELENYRALPFQVPSENHCDIVINKPTILMKLDAGVNLYHHYCDFLNLYASLHVNGSFSNDVEIIVWDVTELHYGELFYDSWKAFAKSGQFTYLKSFEGKKLCIKDFMFPLLPRMRYGLYYNTPLIPGCRTTGLFKAFSKFLIHRLNITSRGPMRNKIRITLLERKTPFRRIVNQAEIVKALKTVSEYDINVVDYSFRDLPFLKQVEISHNSDLMMGMHGAGLTHMLFQPDWASIFEIYNCEDPDCYKELANLRGLDYNTWENDEKLVRGNEVHPKTGDRHAKFANYAFDVDEFMRIVRMAVEKIKRNPSFIEARRKKFERDEF